MERSEMLAINRAGWDEVALQFSGVTALPIYGPLAVTEDELGLFEDVAGKRVLEIGCGDGHSLKYMASRGAAELHGLDLSTVQISMAQELLALADIAATLHCAPMEVDIGIPQGHFDLAFSMYALGWTTDLAATLALIYSYLKPGGYFIFSWEHPFFSCLACGDGMLRVERSYRTEGPELTLNWRGSDAVVMQRRMLSTYINGLVEAGFSIERLVEPALPDRLDGVDDGYSTRWYSVFKAQRVPTTFIMKARKH